jgi:hypothetical protein
MENGLRFASCEKRYVTGFQPTSALSKGPTEYVSFSPHLEMETDPLHETFFFASYLEFYTMGEVYKPSDSECYTPSLEHFTFC